jgi:hypothetical protein
MASAMRLHNPILNEFYQIAFRHEIGRAIEKWQVVLDDWLAYCNNERTQQGKICCGSTPIQTVLDGKVAWRDKSTRLNS